MDLSHNLMDKIELAHVEVPGQRCRVRFVGVEASPPPPMETTAADLTAETTCDGTVHQVRVHLGLEHLSTIEGEDFVVHAIVGALRKAVLGEMPPGAVDYL